MARIARNATKMTSKERAELLINLRERLVINKSRQIETMVKNNYSCK